MDSKRKANFLSLPSYSQMIQASSRVEYPQDESYLFTRACTMLINCIANRKPTSDASMVGDLAMITYFSGKVHFFWEMACKDMQLDLDYKPLGPCGDFSSEESIVKFQVSYMNTYFYLRNLDRI